MKIYIIAHTNNATRYIDGAATSYEQAEKIAESVADGFLMEGYKAPTVQNIIQEQQPDGEPVIFRVYCLKKRGGECINVELYTVNEIRQ